MIKRIKIIAATVSIILLTGSAGLASAAASSNVTFCHSTGSGKYQQLSLSTNGVINGHSHHSQDIIPPFTYLNKGVSTNFPGLNWNAQGQATLNNGCVFIAVGGSGGGTTGSSGSVLGASTNASGTSSSQVAQTPQGGVSAGEGGGAIAYNPVSLIGMAGSLITLAAGMAWLNLRKNFVAK